MRKRIRKVMLMVMLIIIAIAVVGIAIMRYLNIADSYLHGMQYGIVFLILALLVIYAILDYLIKKNMIDGLHQLIRDMEHISRGNFEVVSCVRGNDEFEALSRGINAMVRSISRTSGMLSRVFDMMDAQVAVFEYDDDNKRVMITDRLGQLLGIPTDELSRLVQDKQLFKTRLAWITKNPIPGEESIYEIEGNKSRYVQINIITEENSVFGMISDVTKDIIQKRQMMLERDYDPLTKIRNRRSFEREVKALLQKEHLQECAMVMIDLDKFKGINDNYGHAFGDEYLQKAAGFISRFSNKNCIVARRSGDEFYLVVYGYNTKDEIRKLATDFYAMLKNEPILFPDGTKKSIGMSMGISWYCEGLKDFDYFLKSADIALYEAKETGRNKYGEIEIKH